MFPRLPAFPFDVLSHLKSNYMQNQNKNLHPLRQNMLQRRLQEIEYLERQQALQDDFSTRMYGKKDFSEKKEKRN